MAAWIKISLGMEVGLGPGDFALDGDPALPPQKGNRAPNFRSMFIGPNGWMDQDGTWHGNRPQPRRLCVKWRPSPSSKRGLPSFWPALLLWPSGWMYQDATWYGGKFQPTRLFVRWGPSSPPKFSAHVYYNYCDFVRTLHRRKALLVCSSSS